MNSFNVKKEEPRSDCQMVSIEKIKNPSAPAPIKRNVSTSEEESDDDVQFVKAERIRRPAPSESKIKLPLRIAKPAADDEPIVDPLAVNKFFPCSQCKKILSSGEDLVKHMELRHTKKKRKSRATYPATDGPRSCSICGMNFEKRNSWAAHMNAHKDEDQKVQVECRICGEKFNSNGR